MIPKTYENLIFEIRGTKVMIDFDLATLYCTETKKLKQAVKRNHERFPADFMFELTTLEKNNLIRSVSRLSTLKFSKINPMVFTEQGVAMLSSVINNERAIKINIEIMRAFARYRSLLLENEEMRKDILAIDEKVNTVFKILLQKIDELAPRFKDRKPIGFKRERK